MVFDYNAPEELFSSAPSGRRRNRGAEEPRTRSRWWAPLLAFTSTARV